MLDTLIFTSDLETTTNTDSLLKHAIKISKEHGRSIGSSKDKKSTAITKKQ